MKKMIAMLFSTALLSAGALLAQDMMGPGPGGPGGHGRQGGRRGPGMNREMDINKMVERMKDPRVEAEKKIREKFAAEYDALAKQQEELEKKMQELAGKAGVELPLTQEAKYRKLEAFAVAHKTELEAIKKTMQENPMEGFQQLRELMKKEGVEMPFPGGRFGMGGMRGGPDMDAPEGPRRDPAKEALQILKKEDPEAFKKYEELNKTDKRAARKFLMNYIRSNRDKFMPKK